MLCGTTVPATRDHEQIEPLTHIAGLAVFACKHAADPLPVLDGPGRGVEGVGPALVDEQFAAGTFESAEIRVDGVYERACASVQGGNVGGPVESRGVVVEVVVDEVLQDGDAEGVGQLALLQRPFDF